MNLIEAKKLKQGQTISHAFKRNADGTKMRAKVLSIKIWKRNPEKILISVKHGLYDFAKFTEKELNQITTEGN